MVTYTNFTPKMVNPRDIAGNVEEEVGELTALKNFDMHLAVYRSIWFKLGMMIEIIVTTDKDLEHF